MFKKTNLKLTNSSEKLQINQKKDQKFWIASQTHTVSIQLVFLQQLQKPTELHVYISWFNFSMVTEFPYVTACSKKSYTRKQKISFTRRPLLVFFYKKGTNEFSASCVAIFCKI
jgi:hypothetical protein